MVKTACSLASSILSYQGVSLFRSRPYLLLGASRRPPFELNCGSRVRNGWTTNTLSFIHSDGAITVTSSPGMAIIAFEFITACYSTCTGVGRLTYIFPDLLGHIQAGAQGAVQDGPGQCTSCKDRVMFVPSIATSYFGDVVLLKRSEYEDEGFHEHFQQSSLHFAGRLMASYGTADQTGVIVQVGELDLLNYSHMEMCSMTDHDTSSRMTKHIGPWDSRSQGTR